MNNDQDETLRKKTALAAIFAFRIIEGDSLPFFFLRRLRIIFNVIFKDNIQTIM